MTGRAGKPERSGKAERQVTFPRRDEDGRVVSLVEMTGGAVLATVVGLAAVLLIDGITALLGLGEFGRASGWLAVILPALLFFDDIRAWAGYPVRFMVALVAAALAVGLGLVVAALANTWPPVISGALGAGVAVLIYSPVWFLGVRWLTGDSHREAR